MNDILSGVDQVDAIKPEICQISTGPEDEIAALSPQSVRINPTSDALTQTPHTRQGCQDCTCPGGVCRTGRKDVIPIVRVGANKQPNIVHGVVQRNQLIPEEEVSEFDPEKTARDHPSLMHQEDVKQR